jgi:hypothetical protein
MFADNRQVVITGDTKIYNGLKTDGVGTANGDDVSYHFCPTCGSTVFWNFEGRSVIAIAVGSFADAPFPAPTLELYTPYRHHWLMPVEGAQQFDGFR